MATEGWPQPKFEYLQQVYWSQHDGLYKVIGMQMRKDNHNQPWRIDYVLQSMTELHTDVAPPEQIIGVETPPPSPPNQPPIQPTTQALITRLKNL